MEPLQTRILIAYDTGAPIAYIYFREAFDLLNIPKEAWDGSQILEIGKEFELQGTRYKIVDIKFQFYKELHEMTGPLPGFNMYSLTDEKSDYNSELIVFVEQA